MHEVFMQEYLGLGWVGLVGELWRGEAHFFRYMPGRAASIR